MLELVNFNNKLPLFSQFDSDIISLKLFPSTLKTKENFDWTKTCVFISWQQ